MAGYSLFRNEETTKKREGKTGMVDEMGKGRNSEGGEWK